MFEFLKRMFGKKEVPQTVVEPVQSIVVATPISTSVVEAAPVVKKAKPRNKAKSVDVNTNTEAMAWPFDEPVSDPKPKTKKKSVQAVDTKKSAPAMTAKRVTKKAKPAALEPVIVSPAKKTSRRKKNA